MEAANIDFINGGTVTSPKGYRAGATYAGIKEKKKNSLDLGILFSEASCVTAALFTTNKIKSAPVLLCQEKSKKGRAIALVANSGCANACTGEQGLVDAVEMTDLTANNIGAAAEDGRFDVALFVYNFLQKEQGEGIIDMCRAKNMGVTLMKTDPVGIGAILTGKDHRQIVHQFF